MMRTHVAGASMINLHSLLRVVSSLPAGIPEQSLTGINAHHCSVSHTTSAGATRVDEPHGERDDGI